MVVKLLGRRLVEAEVKAVREMTEVVRLSRCHSEMRWR
jgi:hypothetical protein